MERTVTLIQRMGVELFDDVWHIRAESFYKNPYESHRPGYETWHHDTYLIPFSNVVASLDDADSMKENELLKELKCHGEFEYSEYLPLGYLSFYVPIWYKDDKIREQTLKWTKSIETQKTEVNTAPNARSRTSSDACSVPSIRPLTGFCWMD